MNHVHRLGDDRRFRFRHSSLNISEPDLSIRAQSVRMIVHMTDSANPIQDRDVISLSGRGLRTAP